ncbi:MAG: restriction endonuclease subunit S [Nanoarchaeota archaeon]
MKTKFKQTEIGKIPEDWNIKKIKDISKINELIVSKDYKFDEIEYIDISSVDNGRLLEVQKLKREYAPSRAQRIVRNNDILISTVRPNLKHFTFIKKCNENTVASTGFAVISSKHIDPQYLYHYVTTNRYTNYLSAIADSHTSTYPAINPDVIEESYIPIPNINEQRSIAKILSDLDSKIELNQQINKILEEIGKAIFKHWFIDFEFPNEGGKPYKSSGGDMVDSELRKIPKGWEIGRLGDFGNIQPGFAFKSQDFIEDGYKIIKIRNIQSPIVDVVNVDDYVNDEIFNNIDKKFYLESGDVLIAMTGAELGKVGIIPYFNGIMLLNQRVGKVVSNHKFLFYLYLIQNEVQSLMKGVSSTSSAQGNISNTDIQKIKLVVPPKGLVNKFTAATEKIFTKMIKNWGENNLLSQIRDSLLPKLMSGEIRVKNIAMRN